MEEMNKCSKEQTNELIRLIKHPHCFNSKLLENILETYTVELEALLSFTVTIFGMLYVSYCHMSHSFISATGLCVVPDIWLGL